MWKLPRFAAWLLLRICMLSSNSVRANSVSNSDGPLISHATADGDPVFPNSKSECGQLSSHEDNTRITGGQHAQLHSPGGRSFGWRMPQLVFKPEISVACRGLLGTCSDVSLYDLNQKPGAVYSRRTEHADSTILEGKPAVSPSNVPAVNYSEKNCYVYTQRFPPNLYEFILIADPRRSIYTGGIRNRTLCTRSPFIWTTHPK